MLNIHLVVHVDVTALVDDEYTQAHGHAPVHSHSQMDTHLSTRTRTWTRTCRTRTRTWTRTCRFALVDGDAEVDELVVGVAAAALDSAHSVGRRYATAVGAAHRDRLAWCNNQQHRSTIVTLPINVKKQAGRALNMRVKLASKHLCDCSDATHLAAGWRSCLPS